LITLVFKNPEPETVRVTALDPAGNVVGLMDEMVGAGVVGPPPADPPGLELEAVWEPPPPHPFTKAVRTNTKARK
jgi:hypothetical protein